MDTRATLPADGILEISDDSNVDAVRTPEGRNGSDGWRNVARSRLRDCRKWLAARMLRRSMTTGYATAPARMAGRSSRINQIVLVAAPFPAGMGE